MLTWIKGPEAPTSGKAVPYFNFAPLENALLRLKASAAAYDRTLTAKAPTLSADAKALAAVKSPTDFFKFQSEMLRRSFDAAVATGSKNTEAMFKLTNDAFAPISNRVSLAVEKVSKAA